MYGGVLAIELNEEGIHSVRLPLPAKELNRRFVLAYTGEPRNSGINNWEVTKAHIDGDRKVHKNFDRITEIMAKYDVSYSLGDGLRPGWLRSMRAARQASCCAQNGRTAARTRRASRRR